MKKRLNSLSPARSAEYFRMSGRAEFLAAISFSAFLIVIKVWNIFRYRFDSDESQHLHVVWGWTRGMVQYRDVFDNHMPLFQLLCAPLLALFGEHANDLYWMRLLMLPLYFLSVWALYRIGAILFSRRVGFWAAILVSAYEPYQFCSTEFRTDNLWTPLWLLCLLVLLRGRFSFRRSLVAGLLLGLCFGISMKSAIMFVALALGAAIALLLTDWRQLGLRGKEIAASAGGFIGAALLVPSIIAAFFAAKGLWPQFYYGVFQHNIVASGASTRTYLRMLALPAALPVLLYLTRITSRSPHLATTFRRAFLFATGATYALVLFGFWSHITRQDYLPFYPLLALFCAAGLCRLAEASVPGWAPEYLTSGLRSRLPVLAVLLMLTFNLAPQLPRKDQTRQEIALVREVLALARPGDYVFDCKGETIFHPRSVFYAMEALTLDRLKQGLIADDVQQRCVETRTCVVVTGGQTPPAALRFIKQNFLPVAPGVRVAGCLLHSKSSSEDVQFNVSIPASYEVIAPHMAVTGLLDGTPYTGTRFLEPGTHDFQLTKPAPTLAVMWAQAVDRHFTPFSRLATSARHHNHSHSHLWRKFFSGSHRAET